MDCPACKAQLKKVSTRQGVIIDHCSACRGIWLDEGEIYMFSKKPRWMYQALQNGLLNARKSERACPHCEVKLEQGGFVEPELLIDQCPDCKGLWFDDKELQQALKLGKRKFRMQMAGDEQRGFFHAHVRQADDGDRQRKLQAIRAQLLPLPNLALRSTFCFVTLLGMLAFILLIIGEFAGWSLHVTCGIAMAMIFLQYILSPFILDLLLRWVYSCDWVPPAELPAHLEQFIRATCKNKNMKMPKMGIIRDKSPNAFTYGHTPNNARVIITEGIIELLEPEEAEAVVAHELGHAHHWDILLMTLASMVPIVLYYIYRVLIDSTKSGGNSKGKGYAALLAVVAYLFYIIAEYIVLWLSRTREYWADRFAGEVTNNPNALAGALVKIAYGLVSPEICDSKQDQQKEKSEKMDMAVVQSLGIFDPQAARALALNGYSSKRCHSEQQTNANRERIADAMQWDLWNPWATYHEVHSTHPLPAKRINALTDQAVSLDHDPFIVFDRKKPESYWDEFIVDLLVHFLPLYPFLALLTYFSIFPQLAAANGWRLGGYFLIAMAVCYTVKTLFCYRGAIFPKMKIASLLARIKVSKVRPVPVTLTGKIIGRGVPGYMFSEDMVMRDATGIIFLDYRQPLSILEFFFALLRTDRYIGKEVVLQGWYRRAPVPFIEVKTLQVAGNTHKCYVYHMKLFFALLLFVAAVFCLLKASGM